MNNITEAEYLMYMDIMDPVKSKETEYSKKMERYKDQYKIWTIEKGVEKIFKNYKNESIEIPSGFRDTDKLGVTVGPNTRVLPDGGTSWFIGNSSTKLPYNSGDSWIITNIWVKGTEGTDNVSSSLTLPDGFSTGDLKCIDDKLVRELTSDENSKVTFDTKDKAWKIAEAVGGTTYTEDTVYTDQDVYHYIVLLSEGPYVLRPMWVLKRQNGTVIETKIFFDKEINNTLNKIAGANIVRENKGNIIEFIKNKDIVSISPVYNDSISSFFVEPIFNYEQYSDVNSKFFDNIYTAQTTYLNLDAVKGISGNQEIPLYDQFKSALQHKIIGTGNDTVRVLPSATFLKEAGKNTIFGPDEDQLFLDIINGTLLQLTDDRINTFLKKMARLNFYVINEKVREFNKSLGESVSIQFGDISDFVGNTKFLASPEGESVFQSIKKANSTDKTFSEKFEDTMNAIRETQFFYNGNDTPFWKGLFTQISEAAGSIKDIMINYTVPLDVIPADWKIYPGLYFKETLDVLREIVNSSYFKLDSIENIITYRIVDILVFREFADTKPEEYDSRGDYNNLTDIAELTNFRSAIYNIIKECKETGKFNVNIDDIDSRISTSSTESTEV